MLTLFLSRAPKTIALKAWILTVQKHVIIVAVAMLLLFLFSLYHPQLEGGTSSVSNKIFVSLYKYYVLVTVNNRDAYMKPQLRILLSLLRSTNLRYYFAQI